MSSANDIELIALKEGCSSPSKEIETDKDFFKKENHSSIKLTFTNLNYNVKVKVSKNERKM